MLTVLAVPVLGIGLDSIPFSSVPLQSPTVWLLPPLAGVLSAASVALACDGLLLCARGTGPWSAQTAAPTPSTATGRMSLRLPITAGSPSEIDSWRRGHRAPRQGLRLGGRTPRMGQARPNSRPTVLGGPGSGRAFGG